MSTAGFLYEELLSERLLVRAARPGDGPAFNAAVLESLANLSPWLHWAKEPPSLEISESACRQAYGCFLLDEDFMALFFDRRTGVLVGGGGLHETDWKLRKFEIGYWCRTGFGGQGLITEAARTMANYAMDDLKANRLFLRADERNIRSWRLAERLGFEYEGTSRNADYGPAGQLRNLRVYAKTSA